MSLIQKKNLNGLGAPSINWNFFRTILCIFKSGHFLKHFFFPPLGNLKERLLTVFPNEAQGGSQLELDGRINFRFADYEFADYEPVPMRIRQFIGMAP